MKYKQNKKSFSSSGSIFSLTWCPIFSLLDHDRKFDLYDVFNPGGDLSVLGEEMGDCAFYSVVGKMWDHCNKK